MGAGRYTCFTHALLCNYVYSENDDVFVPYATDVQVAML